MITSFGFNEFEGSLEKDLGFDESISRSEGSDFIKFEAKLPVLYRLLDEVCDDCEGSGRNEDQDRECLRCMGRGKKHSFEWEQAFAVSASFNLMLTLIAYPEIETSSKIPQLLTVELATDHGMHGGSLYGMYSTPLVKWLSSKPFPYQIVEMQQAMEVAYRHMMRSVSRFDRFRAVLDFKGGWLNVDCPGDACGLHPASGSTTMRERLGYEFQCHNTDTPTQQLTLLAGLAALHDLVDGELYKNP